MIVILGTANHFVLDAVGGAVALACGFVVAKVVDRIRVPVRNLARPLLDVRSGPRRSG